jgi:phenylacetate-coenzyme A ligase PaaK-like adenylate-forming protein
MTIPRSPLEAWVKAKIGLPAHQALTRQVLSAYQLEMLRAALDYVMRCSPFYRHHFAAHTPESVQCLQDLARWPLTDAEDLRNDPLAFLCVSQSTVARVVTLPARSPEDRPKRLFFSPADLELAVDFFHHGFSTLLTPGQRMLVLMPCRRPNSVGDLLSRGLARLSVSSVAHGPLQSVEAAVDAVLKHHIDSLVGIPSQIAVLSRHPHAGRIPAGQIRSIWLGTENTQRSLVEEIRRVWNCPVFQHYGAAEMCPGGGVECQTRDGFHLREADLFIEIVDPCTARPVADGTYGEVAVTTLTREAMPLVRYRTGHRAAFLTADCPCGSGLRRMTSICSRSEEPITS